MSTATNTTNPSPHEFSWYALKVKTRSEPVAVQALQTQMVVRYMKGEAMEKTLAWAEGELEGFMRN